MKRWRCTKRACRRHGWVRKSTKKDIAPNCRRCGCKMTIDHYRTSKRESQARNCWCSDVPWSAKGGPHTKEYCESLRRKQYEQSVRDYERSQILQSEATETDSERAGAELADCPF